MRGTVELERLRGELERLRLDETGGSALPHGWLEVGPGEIVTIRVRPLFGD